MLLIAPVGRDSARRASARLSYQGGTGALKGNRTWVPEGDPTSQGARMGRDAVLFIVAVAATVFLGACGTHRVEVGELRTETRSAEVEGAESVRANLRLALGELDVGGGADELMEADFIYNVSAWEPRGLREGIPTRDVRNEWDLRLNDAVPIDLTVQMGGGVSNLDLDSLTLTG